MRMKYTEKEDLVMVMIMKKIMVMMNVTSFHHCALPGDAWNWEECTEQPTAAAARRRSGPATTAVPTALKQVREEAPKTRLLLRYIWTSPPYFSPFIKFHI